MDEGHDFEPEWLKLVAQMVHPETNLLSAKEAEEDAIPLVAPQSAGRSGALPEQEFRTIFWQRRGRWPATASRS